MWKVGDSLRKVGHFSVHEAVETDSAGNIKVVGYIVVGPTGHVSSLFDTEAAAVDKAKWLERMYRNRPKLSPKTQNPKP
jgi:hypothetical protein